MEFSFKFLQILFWGIYLLAPILLMMVVLISFLGMIVGRMEGWKRADALYWAFITALTVGYGDIRPTHHVSRVFAIFIAVIGIMFAGVLVAVTVEAASVAFKEHVAPETIERFSNDLG